MDSIAQPAVIVQDGVHWSEQYQEYEIVIDGDPVACQVGPRRSGEAESQGQAWRSYNEMLRVDGEHRRRQFAEPVTVLPDGTLLATIDVASESPVVTAGHSWGG